MGHTPSRKGERKLVTVGSVWTDGSTDVKVMALHVYGDYTYVVYRVDGQKKNADPLDRTAFALRYTAKVVRHTDVQPAAKEIAADPDAGKVRMVGWTG